MLATTHFSVRPIALRVRDDLFRVATGIKRQELPGSYEDKQQIGTVEVPQSIELLTSVNPAGTKHERKTPRCIRLGSLVNTRTQEEWRSTHRRCANRRAAQSAAGWSRRRRKSAARVSTATCAGIRIARGCSPRASVVAVMTINRELASSFSWSMKSELSVCVSSTTRTRCQRSALTEFSKSGESAGRGDRWPEHLPSRSTIVTSELPSSN